MTTHRVGAGATWGDAPHPRDDGYVLVAVEGHEDLVQARREWARDGYDLKEAPTPSGKAGLYARQTTPPTPTQGSVTA